MKIYYILLFLTSSNAFSQDIIYGNEGGKINSIIKEANNENIKYVNFNDPDGSVQILERDRIKKIIFQNGAIEVFRNVPAPSKLSKEEVKAIILEKINRYAFDAKSSLRSYRGTFEADYLKLWIMRSRDDAPFTEPILFDFSRAYDFQDISYRNNEAFINVFVGFIDRKGRVDKVKLVIRVIEKEQAEEIVTILKIYNRLLAEENIRVDDK